MSTLENVTYTNNYNYHWHSFLTESLTKHFSKATVMQVKYTTSGFHECCDKSERQRGRQAEIQRDTATESQIDRGTETPRDGETERQRDRDIVRQRDREAVERTIKTRSGCHGRGL